jgi:hypothetical protein
MGCFVFLSYLSIHKTILAAADFDAFVGEAELLGGG